MTSDEDDGLTDRIATRTPWWFISVFVHGALFALCALIVVIARPTDRTEIVAVSAPHPREKKWIQDRPEELNLTKELIEIERDVIDPVFDDNRDLTNESETLQELQSNRGDAGEFKDDAPYRGPGMDEPIGLSSGGGSNCEGQVSRRRERRNGPPETAAAVEAGLAWLARHQNEAGAWSMTGYIGQCGSRQGFRGDCTPHGIHPSFDHAITHNYDVGLTGLALLAFLGAGYTHSARDSVDGIHYGEVVRRAIGTLIAQQDDEGCVGSRGVTHYMYNHAIAALALSEAYGMTGSRKFKRAAQRSIDFIMASQNPGKGWRYSARAGENDTSVTGWAVMALKSAELSGLRFDRSVAYDGSRAWLDTVAYRKSGGTGSAWKSGYKFDADADISIPGVNDQYDQHPSMTAIAVMCRIFMDKRRDAKVRGGVGVVMEDLPTWDSPAIDFYYWYYASLALHQFTGGSGALWKKWNAAMAPALVDHQNRTDGSDKKGSWEPMGRWCSSGGRVYATAINTLTLEVYYRYASVFGGH